MANVNFKDYGGDALWPIPTQKKTTDTMPLVKAIQLADQMANSLEKNLPPPTKKGYYAPLPVVSIHGDTAIDLVRILRTLQSHCFLDKMYPHKGSQDADYIDGMMAKVNYLKEEISNRHQEIDALKAKTKKLADELYEVEELVVPNGAEMAIDALWSTIEHPKVGLATMLGAMSNTIRRDYLLKLISYLAHVAGVKDTPVLTFQDCVKLNYQKIATDVVQEVIQEHFENGE